MAQEAPGKHYREGVSLLTLTNMFSTENKARKWLKNGFGVLAGVAHVVDRRGPTKRLATCRIVAPIAVPASLSKQAR